MQVRLKPDPTGDHRRIQAGDQGQSEFNSEIDVPAFGEAASVGSAL